jgi:4-alpha-glucanotransferase
MIKKEFPNFLVVAEDLGDLSAAAEALIAQSGLPGMRVLQFAFNGKPNNPHLPHNIGENTLCYTGTHDNNTLIGWINAASKKERQQAMQYLGITRKKDLRDALLNAALASKARITIIPLQDWLGLGREARLNTPGTAGGSNWKWRPPKEALTPDLAQRIRLQTKKLHNR